MGKSKTSIRRIALSAAVCLALLAALPRLPANSTARAASLTSLTVGGVAVDPSRDASGPGWWYNSSYDGTGLQVLSLIGFDSGQDVTAGGDLIIAAADTNIVGSIYATGTLAIAGSGAIIADGPVNSKALVAMGAALFVKDGTGKYVLQNDCDIYDWVTLPAGDFIIPSGKTLNLPVNIVWEDYAANMPDMDAATTAKLTVPSGSSLIIESGGSVIVDSFHNGGFLYLPAVLEVIGELAIRDGGRIDNYGSIFNMTITEIMSNTFALDTRNLSKAEGGGAIRCEGTGTIFNLWRGVKCGSVMLKAAENGIPTPLSLNMKNGILTLVAGDGRFAGGVNCEFDNSANGEICIADTAPGRGVELDFMEISAEAGAIIYSLGDSIHDAVGTAPPATAYYHTYGPLTVNGNMVCEGDLLARNLDLHVSGNISARLLDVNAATVSCGGSLTAGELHSSYAYMNLNRVYSSQQEHINSFISASVPGDIYAVNPADVYSRTFNNEISRRYALYQWQPFPLRIYGDLYNDAPCIAGTLSSLDPTISDASAFVWDGTSALSFDNLYNSDPAFDGDKISIYLWSGRYHDFCPGSHEIDSCLHKEEHDDPDPLVVLLHEHTFEHDFPVMSFVILGADSLGQPRVWQVWRGSAEKPDVKELYAVRAINYFLTTQAYVPAPPGDEYFLQSDHTGNGVLGGGGGLSFLDLIDELASMPPQTDPGQQPPYQPPYQPRPKPPAPETEQEPEQEPEDEPEDEQEPEPEPEEEEDPEQETESGQTQIEEQSEALSDAAQQTALGDGAWLPDWDMGWDMDMDMDSDWESDFETDEDPEPDAEPNLPKSDLTSGAPAQQDRDGDDQGSRDSGAGVNPPDATPGGSDNADSPGNEEDPGAGARAPKPILIAALSAGGAVVIAASVIVTIKIKRGRH